MIGLRAVLVDELEPFKLKGFIIMLFITLKTLNVIGLSAVALIEIFPSDPEGGVTGNCVQLSSIDNGPGKDSDSGDGQDGISRRGRHVRRGLDRSCESCLVGWWRSGKDSDSGDGQDGISRRGRHVRRGLDRSCESCLVGWWRSGKDSDSGDGQDGMLRRGRHVRRGLDRSCKSCIVGWWRSGGVSCACGSAELGVERLSPLKTIS